MSRRKDKARIKAQASLIQALTEQVRDLKAAERYRSESAYRSLQSAGEARRAVAAERNQAQRDAKYWRDKYYGLLTLSEALDRAQDDTGYVFNDDASNGVSPTVPNESWLGEHPPIPLPFRFIVSSA